MTNIKLSDGQNGYDAIGEHITKYWKDNGLKPVIVSIATSHDGVTYDKMNEIASPDCVDCIEFLTDWWEGEKYLKFFGIMAVDDVNVLSDKSKMTNFEKIKQMSVDEFAKTFPLVFSCGVCSGNEPGDEPCDEKCEKNFKQWLESEAQEND